MIVSFASPSCFRSHFVISPLLGISGLSVSGDLYNSFDTLLI